MQTKKQSLLESIASTSVGFVVSLAATFLIFPVVGVESTGVKNIIISVLFTCVSIIRGYYVRRFFNNLFQEKETCECCSKKHPMKDMYINDGANWFCEKCFVNEF